jgi:hypothetical protein
MASVDIAQRYLAPQALRSTARGEVM